MDYPNLPTDNLYKFIALAGLALLLLSIVYPSGKLLELEVQIADIKAVSQKLRFESGLIDKEIEQLEKSPTISCEVASTVRDKTYQLDLKNEDLKAQMEKLSIQLKWIHRYKDAALLGSLLGNILMLLGFYAWYSRVQRPQDQLLQRQLGEGKNNFPDEQSSSAEN